MPLSNQDDTTIQKAADQAVLTRLLYSPVDAASLACFRMAFGGLLLYQTISYWGIIERFFVEPRVHFSYPLAPFIQPLPLPWMKLYFVLLALAALGVTIGLFYQVCSIALFVLYGYLFLIDQAYFNNHTYLCVLVAMWMAIAPAHRTWSLDVKLKRITPGNAIPAWPIIVLRAQWVIVYTFGALAKLNGDWLRGEPMTAFLHPHANAPFIGELLQTNEAALFLAWGGFIFDLLIGPALLWRRTRPFAIIFMLFFHISNHFLFHIGIFPWLAMTSMVLFIEPSTPRRWFRSKLQESAPQISKYRPIPALTGFIVIYMVIQLLAPLRPHLYPGHVSWTHEGWFFSWTMKLEMKDCFVGMQVIDRKTGRAWEVDQSRDLNSFQRHRMWQDPAMIAHYARYVREQAIHSGIEDPLVIVDAVVSMNGRPFQYMIDPHVELAQTQPTWPKPAPWIVPLDEDAPIGNYAWSERETFERVMAVIADARQRPTPDKTNVSSGIGIN